MGRSIILDKDTRAYLADSRERVMATQGRRRSSAAGPMGSPNTRRRRTRAAARAVAIKEAY